MIQTSNWQWKFKDNSINIYYEEHVKETEEPSQNILMMPTISDVSTVEEWRLVAGDIVQRDGNVNCRATIVDWPGLGYSDRPKIDYNADVLEKFLVDFINSPGGPIKQPGTGGGHCNNFHLTANIRLSFIVLNYICLIILDHHSMARLQLLFMSFQTYI